MKRFRFSELGLIEYNVKNGNLAFQDKPIQNVKVFETPEEAKMDYYRKKKKEIINHQEFLNSELKKTNDNLIKLNLEFKDILEDILQDSPELLI